MVSLKRFVCGNANGTVRLLPRLSLTTREEKETQVTHFSLRVKLSASRLCAVRHQNRVHMRLRTGNVWQWVRRMDRVRNEEWRSAVFACFWELVATHNRDVTPRLEVMVLQALSIGGIID